MTKCSTKKYCFSPVDMNTFKTYLIRYYFTTPFTCCGTVRSSSRLFERYVQSPDSYGNEAAVCRDLVIKATKILKVVGWAKLKRDKLNDVAKQ